MPQMFTLRRAFDHWNLKTDNTDEQLAEYLGITTDKLTTLANAPLQGEGLAGEKTQDLRGYSGGLTPVQGELERLAKEHNIKPDRLYGVWFGEAHWNRDPIDQEPSGSV